MTTVLASRPTVTRSQDGTLKIVQQLDDGVQLESCVLDLPYRTPRRVICISSQAGCPFRCTFCASGARPFLRLLTAAEIVDQVGLAHGSASLPIGEPFDVTYMGVGEPLANFMNVTESFDALTSRWPEIVRLNVSTIGPRGQIARLARTASRGRLHLQWSLHAASDAERRRLLQWPVPTIRETLEEIALFASETGDVPCINFLLFAGVNDSDRHAAMLASAVRSIPCYVKLSTYNPVNGTGLLPSSCAQKCSFGELLAGAGIAVKYFESHGSDVKAGCGQMVSEMG